MKTIVYEKSLRAQICEKILTSSPLTNRFGELIILPIPSTRDGVHINGTELTLSDALSGVSRDTLVVGYALPPEIAGAVRGRGALVWDGASDERFLSENAELTALATLGILICEGRRAPSDMSVGIVGYGRIGKVLLRLLLYIGARVRVYTSRTEVRMELSALGVDTAEAREGAELSGLDILINTAPARIFSFNDGAPQARIIELASGSNFPEHVSVERYPSLPARAYPETAGRVFAEAVENFLFSLKEGGE